MSIQDVVRAWKDPQYRQGLAPSELARLPENPAGMVELTDHDLGDVSGGNKITAPEFCDPRTNSVLCSSWGCEPTRRGPTC